jgi:branched-chain amino acid aminotransferase
MPLSDEALAAEILRVLEAAKNEDSYVRIMLTRGSGPLGLDPDLATQPLRVILVEPVTPPPRSAYADGIALICVQVARTVDGTAAAGAKVSNYLANLLAMKEAKGRGAAEALVLDGRGDVVEGASSNVFVVKDGVLKTPPESAGILPGITRAHVLKVAHDSGVAVEIKALRPEDLYRADEVFITSSIREILPAVRVDDRVIGTGKPGPLTRKLHQSFRESLEVKGPLPWLG